MPGIHNYIVFLLAGIILNLTPGTDTIYILTRSIAHGKKAGIASALGISTGCLVHISFAAFGLSVILARSALAFNVVRLAGGAYLLYLGIRALLTKSFSFSLSENKKKPRSAHSIYVQGILTNVLNPKVALFFLSFLPQFVDPMNTYGPLPFLILGLTFLTTGSLWCLCLAFISSSMTEFLRSNKTTGLWMNRLSGLVFILLGLRLLLKNR